MNPGKPMPPISKEGVNFYIELRELFIILAIADFFAIDSLPPPQPLIHSLIRRFRSVSSQAPHGFTAHSFRLSAIIFCMILYTYLVEIKKVK